MEDKIKEFGQTNFDLPHDVVKLPSNGIFYKNKKKSIKVGYLTAADENLIIGNSSNFMMHLLRNKIYEYDIKPEDLVESDIEAILIFLRNTSFGPELEMRTTDPAAGNLFNVTIDLSELNIIKGVDPDADGVYNIKLPKSGDLVKVKPLTYGDVSEINDLVESYPKNRIAPRVTLRLSKEIIQINDNTNKGDIYKYVESMPISDSKFIRKYLNENEPRLDLKKNVKTPSGDMTTVNAGFGVDFFRPFFGL